MSDDPQTTTRQTPQRRGSGRTTRQMMDAPQKALFIWCNDALSWPRSKAKELGRPDLVIEGPEVLTSRGRHLVARREWPAIILDHWLADMGLDPEQYAGWIRLQAMVRA